jgi:hypothetical protein
MESPEVRRRMQRLEKNIGAASVELSGKRPEGHRESCLEDQRQTARYLENLERLTGR